MNDQIGVDVGDGDVVTSDNDQFHWGTGTFASRGAVAAGNAATGAASYVRNKILRLATELLEVVNKDLNIRAGKV